MPKTATRDRQREISFEATGEEMDLIMKVVERAHGYGLVSDPLTMAMDLCATNANGRPLDFARLLDFPKADFFHDIAGIRRHIDRDTGKLRDHFVPRCARPAA